MAVFTLGANFMSLQPYINCSCSHLSTFGVLMDITDKEYFMERNLQLKTWSHTPWHRDFFQHHSQESRGLHLPCPTAFLIALKLRRPLVQREFPCKVMAIMLHYMFLCVFSWMFLEAVHLYRMLTEMRDINHGQMRFYYSIGYGAPAIVVGLSVGVRADQYGNYFFCWLSIYESVIWRPYWAGIVLLPLLGATWVLAILSVNESLEVLHFIFSLFSCITGIYIFIGYCIINKKVRQQLIHTWARMRGKKVPYDESLSGTRTTVVSRSALAYQNSSFDVLQRNMGISTSSTTSRSTTKTSSSPYRSDSHLKILLHLPPTGSDTRRRSTRKGLGYLYGKT
ncbi:protocadherin-like wing polarity protein stan [Caerostris extrusa]|uniref:Protocadherin-like wing polarity protein stan n=1 Tax=Caerostris extrusa TaxID=172846 RepID=A0AAV4MZU6_CAEEX|nr:protocadherin-like wing polarity protein stan [Caerostris extrusa]